MTDRLFSFWMQCLRVLRAVNFLADGRFAGESQFQELRAASLSPSPAGYGAVVGGARSVHSMGKRSIPARG